MMINKDLVFSFDLFVEVKRGFIMHESGFGSQIVKEI